jgi:hypothetical protein
MAFIFIVRIVGVLVNLYLRGILIVDFVFW